jgi:shikimate dehydrogenase
VGKVTDKFAVFGNPILHSKSPLIHGLFAKQTLQDMEYCIVQPAVDGFDAAAKKFFVDGASGANVTAPFKLDAYNFADELTTRAKEAGSVNTLKYLANGNILGDTTDGPGLVEDLRRQFGTLEGLSVLLLGSGGAARGVVGSLFAAGVAKMCIANRTAYKALELADIFAAHGDVYGVGLDEVPDSGIDLIINSTSSSMTDDLPAIDSKIFLQAQYIYDMAYKNKATSFMQWALQCNNALQVSDGLGMLVGQAAESFYIWRGVKPNIEPVIDALREQLK